MAFAENVMDFGFLTGMFGGFQWGNGLLVLLLIGISTVAITRDTRNMRLLLFPLALGWSRTGLETSNWILAGAAIVTTVTLVGAHNIGATLEGIQKATTTLYKGSTSAAKKRMDNQFQYEESVAGHKASLALQKASFKETLKKATGHKPEPEEEEIEKYLRSRI